MNPVTKDFLLFSLPLIFIGYVLIKNRLLGAGVILVGYILGISELLSCKILKADVDLFTILRMDLDMLFMAPAVMKKLFVKVMALTVLMLIIVCFKLMSTESKNRFFSYCKRLYYSFLQQSKKGEFHFTTKIVLILLLLIPVLSTNTLKVMKNIYKETKSYVAYTFCTEEELFQRMGAVKNYKHQQNIEAVKGKNVVVIYCESLENGYLDNSLFPGLTVNLNKMKESSFTCYDNYQNLFGAGWTIGALYATQTSFPCLFGHDGNDVFNKVKDTQVVSYANVMKKAGYNNLFLSSANFEFGGTGNMMRMLGYELKSFDKYDVETEKTGWGVHDKDLFEQAKIEYRKMANGATPFNLTLLTVDTHFTNGIPDKRMQKKIAIDREKKSMEYCVASLDYLIGDFYEFMSKQRGFDNTVLIIIGDHPVMGSVEQTPVVKILNKKERHITLLTNGLPTRFKENDKLAYYNMPNFILDSVGIRHNAIFLDDMLGSDAENNIKANAALYTHLNLKLNQ